MNALILAAGKGTWVNSGVMMLDRALLARIPAVRASGFGHEILPQWLADGVPVYGWPLPTGTFLVDVGTPESYALAEQEWRHSDGMRPGVDASLSGREA